MRWLLVCLSLSLVVFGCRKDEAPLHVQTNANSDSGITASPGSPDAAAPAPYGDISLKAQTTRVPVIMFHDIVPERNKGTVWFDCTTEEFGKILDTIVEKKLVPISLDDLYASLTGQKPAPLNAIVLTFDDNYQSFFDIAYPLLKAKGYPSAVFVHTNFVGKKDGRAKMDWVTLQLLLKEGLVTVGSHTLSHPDLTTISRPDQEREINESKRILEEKLGVKIPYFAYPDGKNDPISQELVRAAGYKMAFTVDNGPAEESPGILLVNRYLQLRFDKALEDTEAALDNSPATFLTLPLKDAPITYEKKIVGSTEMAFVRGGLPSSVRGVGRLGVLEFMAQSKAVAGINGTFFAMAEIKGTSNEMVGPVYTSNEKAWVPDLVLDRVNKIHNRPMVMWNHDRICFFPFNASSNREEPLRNIMPDFTDAFVAGVWLIHEGKPRSKDEIMEFGARDAMDPRRRAFFGVAKDGTIVLGASLDSVSAEKLAAAAAESGVEEAVMMDSGFSTSLCYGDKVVASGHSTAETPSRPVPHAIVLMGTLAQDPNTIEVPQPDKVRRKKRKK